MSNAWAHCKECGCSEPQGGKEQVLIWAKRQFLKLLALSTLNFSISQCLPTQTNTCPLPPFWFWLSTFCSTCTCNNNPRALKNSLQFLPGSTPSTTKIEPAHSSTYKALWHRDSEQSTLNTTRRNHNPAYDFCDDEGPAHRCRDLTSLLFREGVERLELDPLRLGGRSDLMLPKPPFSPFSRMSPGCSPLGCGDDGSCEKPPC